MSYKTVFAPVMFEHSVAAVASAALAVAGHERGHVMGHHLRRNYDYFPLADVYTGVVVIPKETLVAHDKAENEFSGKLKSAFETECKRAGAHMVEAETAHLKEGLTASWTDADGIVPDSFGWEARVADLTVCGKPGKSFGRFETELFEALLMASGRPVLMVPEKPMTQMPKSICVAWDGSLQAARALFLALPFLRAAKQVHVVTVGRQDLDAPDGASAVRYLARHAIAAQHRTIERASDSVSDSVLTDAEVYQSDLLVIGGYSHSRLQESLLGGVTRQIVKNAELPVLLAH